MKILHITSSLKVGGAESLLVDLLKDLKERGIENSVLYFHEGPNVEKIKNMQIECIKVEPLFKMYDPIFLFNFFRLIKKINPDVIHSSLWAANFLSTIASKIFKIPILCSIHLASNLEDKSSDSRIRAFLEKITFKADSLVAVSHSLKYELVQKYPQLKNKIEVIENGIDVNRFGCSLQRQSSNFIIGTVGRFIPRKNHKLLIEAFSELHKIYPETELHLVGQGPLENELKNLVFNFGLVSEIKFIKTDDASQLYKNFDCFVLPSDQEGLSIALLEALASGVASIVVGKDRKHDLISQNENGLIVKKEKNELIFAISKLILDPDLKIELSQNGRELANSKYSLDKMVSSYIEVYKRINI